MQATIDLLSEIKSLMKKAEKQGSSDNIDKAVQIYNKALDLIPDPIENSVYATQIFIAIGELYFIHKNYDEAFKHFSEAVRCKGGLGLSHIHLRLGQLRYERGEMKRAKDELMRAYMGSGYLIFENEDQKYYNIIKDMAEKRGG